MELYDASEKYPGFEYPAGLEKVADLELIDLDVWFILDAAFAKSYCESMSGRYPNRKLVPFAKRCDCDDVACFEVDKPGTIQIIHDFAEPGWEQRDTFSDFWSWFVSAVNLFIERSREEEADEL